MQKIIFFDIETASEYSSYEKLSEAKQLLWDKKCLHLWEEDETWQDLYTEQSAIFPEFGRIVCISYGGYDEEWNLITKSFAWKNEKQLLSDFYDVLRQFPHYLLCGHNIKWFDLPYICKRGVIHWLQIPSSIQVAGKKPREILHIDTLELWKFGHYKGWAPLGLLCELFDIPTPKDDIDGSEVSRVFREDWDIDRIAKYCEKDVVATAQVYERLKESLR